MRIGTYEVPDVLGTIEELRVIWTVTVAAVETLRARLAAAQTQLDIETADEAGLARMEAMFGLDATGYTVDERRFRLRCWTEDIGLYSAAHVKDWIETFGGEGTSVVYTAGMPASCTVRIPLSSEKKTDDLRRKLTKMLPVGTTVDVSANYETFAGLAAQTWSDLNARTFGEVKRGE
ncbi:MAG: hypothetical protein IKN72_06365 [Clostridia bacterium]|nr:hypothetical protein [Clostridia bacterium]